MTVKKRTSTHRVVANVMLDGRKCPTNWIARPGPADDRDERRGERYASRAPEDAPLGSGQADPIAEFGQALDAARRKGPPACPAAMLPTECARPSARAALIVIPASASSGVRPNKVQAMFIASVGESSGEVPGLQSVATAIGTLCLRSSVDGRLPLLLQRIESAGEKHGDGARRGHRLRAGFVEMLEMIGGKRAIFGRERGAVLVRQLLGMKPHAQAVVRRRLEQPLDLVGREGDRVAEGIDAGRDALLGRGRDQLVDDFADVMRAAVALVGGERVKREQRRDDPHRFALAELAARSSAAGARSAVSRP